MRLGKLLDESIMFTAQRSSYEDSITRSVMDICQYNAKTSYLSANVYCHLQITSEICYCPFFHKTHQFKLSFISWISFLISESTCQVKAHLLVAELSRQIHQSFLDEFPLIVLQVSFHFYKHRPSRMLTCDNSWDTGSSKLARSIFLCAS